MNFFRFLKCLLDFGSVRDGSVCWFSENYWDVHDYPINKGGNGFPSHFYVYKCWKCGKKFYI